ncbi:MAG: hypothetical protein EZS28_026083, partial [Streblomastix strix]
MNNEEIYKVLAQQILKFDSAETIQQRLVQKTQEIIMKDITSESDQLIQPKNKQIKIIQQIQSKIPHLHPIYTLNGRAFDNEYRRRRSFYACSEASSTFGQNNQIFDNRFPVYRIQRFASLTKLYYNTPKTKNLALMKIQLPEITINFDHLKNRIIETRQQLIKDQHLGKESEIDQIEIPGIFSYEQVYKLKNDIRRAVEQQFDRNYPLFILDQLNIFLDYAMKYYQEIENKIQHIDIDVHFGMNINMNTNDDCSQLVNENQTTNKSGLLCIGDIHGNFNALLKVLDIVDDILIQNNHTRGKIVFLGDFIDRGDYSLECALLIIAYKLAFPNRIFLIRGNHDSLFSPNNQPKFNKQISKQFPQNETDNYHPLVMKLVDIFTLMPISCIATLIYHTPLPAQQQSIQQIQSSSSSQQQLNTPPFPLKHIRRIQLVHGGISPLIPIPSNEDEINQMNIEDIHLIK